MKRSKERMSAMKFVCQQSSSPERSEQTRMGDLSRYNSVEKRIETDETGCARNNDVPLDTRQLPSKYTS